MRARESWLSLQRRIAGSLRREVSRIAPFAHRGFSRYRREYERDLGKPYAPIDVRGIVRAAAHAHVVHVGDFHALPASQLTALRLIEELLDRSRRVVLGLEMADRRHQTDLDAFADGRISSEVLRARLHWEETWGFDWEGYGDLLECARAQHLKLLALNESAAGATLEERDRAAAEIIARATLADERAVVVVLFGELHVSRSHLPRAVARSIAAAAPRSAARRRQITIHQSPERLYFDLVRRGAEDRIGAVRYQGGDAFAVLTATPAAQSLAYLDWLDRCERVAVATEDDSLEADWSFVDLSDSLRLVIEAIARYFSVPTRGLLDFTVTTGDVEEFLHLLRVRRGARAAEVRRLARLARLGRGVLLPEGNLVFLPRFTLGEAGTLAAQLIHRVRAGSPREPMAPRQYFYFRVVREAIGALGRRLLDPKSPLADCTRPKRGARSRRVADLAARHADLAERAHAANASARLAFPFRLPLDVHVPLTRAIGSDLGDRLFEALMDDRLARAEVRTLFLRPLHRGDAAAEAYFALRRRVLDAAALTA